MLFGDKTQKGGGGGLLFFGGAKLELPHTLLRKIKILGGQRSNVAPPLNRDIHLTRKGDGEW